MIFTALQKEVITKGRATQKYSLSYTSMKMRNIAERKKKIQYLLADCVSLITKNLGKYKCYTITISNNRNCTARIIPTFDIYFN